MADILFPPSSAPGETPIEGEGVIINALVEGRTAGAQSGYTHRSAPGLRALADTADASICRGLMFVNNALLMVRGADLLKIEKSGSVYNVTDIGDMDGSGPVYFARNNKSPTPDIVAVSSEGAFSIDMTSGPVSFPDPDLDQPNSVTFQDGYFIFSIADGRAYVSGINDTSVSALDFTTAQARPGGLRRAISFGQQIFLFGPSFIEVFINTAQPEGFPFTRQAVIPLGLLAADAIAGWEDGWSASLIWVANDRSVYKLDNGYVPQKISKPDLDRKLGSVADTSQLHAFVYTHPGHACWAISGPDFTWVYDLSTNEWHERQTYLRDNWLARCSVNGWGGDWIVGHAENGVVHKIDDNYHREGNLPRKVLMVSQNIVEFPSRIGIPRADFNMLVGQGLPAGEQPIETDPRCWISYSKDGGSVYSVPVFRETGRMGERKTRITINRLGQTGPIGLRFKLEFSDPRPLTVFGGTVETDVRPR